MSATSVSASPPPLDDNSSKHQNILDLQKVLEETFPVCNDLSQISVEGFTPHLSLGQFQPNRIDAAASEFRSTWTTITFDVKEVHFISREDFDSPFKIRKSIKIGPA